MPYLFWCLPFIVANLVLVLLNCSYVPNPVLVIIDVQPKEFIVLCCGGG